MEIELLADLFFGPACAMTGSRLEDDKLIQVAAETFQERPFLIVRNWMLIDVLLSDADEQKITEQGLVPTILYSQTTVFGLDKNYGVSRGVLSNFQHRYDDCFFESKEMLYILGGRGFRKYASVPAISALAASFGSRFLC